MLDQFFRKGQTGEWLFLGVTSIAILSATIATTKLEEWADQSNQHNFQLNRLQTTTNRLDALEWRVRAKRKIEPEIRKLLAQQHQQSEETLTALKTTATSPENLEKTIAAYDTYVKSMNQILQLLEAEKFQEAEEFDETVVDPNYDKLYEIIAQASTEAAQTSTTVGEVAFWGIIFTNLSLMMVITLIFRQHRQANHRIQQALLEQEAIRRSEQALKQERALLETKVQERTAELEEKNAALTTVLADLKSSQAQLIQSEKMSSLGQLVAGVAHEINNPVNFIYGNLSHANEYMDDLLQLVTLYQAECLHPSPAIVDKIEEMDLEFLKVDLQQLFNSMEMGTERIQAIVLSLRNFSRLDEAEFKAADIHEGIENTLIILASRLKIRGSRPDIQVVKHYAQLPLIECYAGQLNQVFMNVLSNAIDAIDLDPKHEANSTTPTITIRTEAIKSNRVRVTISDNGMGISESVQSKLFDPFFTTKPVGKGTGLGMSISYRIVAQHQGELYCNSEIDKGTDFIIEIPIKQLI